MKEKKHINLFNLFIFIFSLGYYNVISQNYNILITPKNNTFISPDSIFFSWNYNDSAVQYNLFISDDPNFIINTSIFNISYHKTDTVIKNIANCKKYFWKIKTTKINNYSFSETNSFNAFNPNCINGLELWLSPDSGITKDISNNISNWNDRSGNNINAFQSVSQNRPILTIDPISSSKLIYFDGTDDFFQLNNTIKISTFFIAHKWLGSQTNFPGYNCVLSTQTYTPNGIVFMGNLNTTNYYTDGVSNTFSSSETYVNTVNTINLNPIKNLKIFSAIRSSSVSLSNFNISKYLNDLTSFWNGSLGDIIIYNRPLSVLEYNNIHNFIYQKNIPPLDLGENLTLCSFPITLKPKYNNYVSYLWQDNSTKDSLVIHSSGKYKLTVTDIFGNTYQDSVKINIDNTNYIIDFEKRDTTICEGKELIIYAGPKHFLYNWSDGSTNNFIKITNPGNYYVTSLNCLNNITTDTITVAMLQSPRFDLGNDTLVCSNSNFYLNPTIINSLSPTFLWSDGNNTNSISPNNSSEYWLKLTNSNNCSFSDTINIQIDNSLNTLSLGPNISLCAGNQIALTSGIQPGLTYTWSTGQNSAAITVTNTAEYSVVVTNTNNCVAKDTINITITGQVPSPQFATNIACKNQTVNFTNLSLAPTGNTITSYFWNFGDPLSASNTSTLTNPSYTYTNTGIYTVSLSISTDVGCSKSITKTLTVSPTPTVNYVNSISCQNDSTSFTGSAITAPLSVSSYQWNFGDPASGSANNAFVQNPKHLFSNVAFFPVKFLVTNSAGCKDSIIKNINVRSEVKADFTYQPPCAKTNVLFQDNSIAPNPITSHPRTWVLSLPTNTFTFSGLTFNNTFTTTGVFPVSLTVNGTNGCTSTITKFIQIYQKPTVDFQIPSICLNDTLQIINNSLPGSGAFNQFTWTLNSNTISAAASPSLSFASPGTYSLALTISNTSQCKDSISKTFTVNPLPNVTFTSIPPTYIYKDSIVTFVPSLINGSSYNWTIGGQNYNVPSPVIQIDSVGTYSVNLFLIDENGCKNSSSGTFKTYDSYLDLEVNSVISNVSSNNYLNVQVDLINKGTIPIANFEIKKTVSDASQVKETFNGTINPGVRYRYQFNSEDNISNDNKNRLICVELESVNRRMDQNTKNNSNCEALNINEIQVFEPQPNPANQIDVLLPVIVPFSQEVKVKIITSLGELVSPEYSVQLNEGLNYIKIPSSGLSHGTYLIKVLIEDKAFVKKLLKY